MSDHVYCVFITGSNHTVLKSHPFFSKYKDFDKIRDKGYTPPYIPSDEVLKSVSKVDKHIPHGSIISAPGAPIIKKYDTMLSPEYSFADMMRFYNKGSWIPDESSSLSSSRGNTKTVHSRFRVPESKQIYFKEWHYCSPEVIREESELSKQKKSVFKK